MFTEITSRIDDYLHLQTDERLFILPGLRGTGKTTLLAQTYSWLRSHGVDSARILYFEADEAWLRHGSRILDLVDAYERHLRSDILMIPRETPCFLLIDEVQSDPRWDLTLKILYDRTKSLFVLATGSSALMLHEGAEVSRRSHDVRIGPLTFSEYLWLKRGLEVSRDLKDEAFRALFMSPDAKTAWGRLNELRHVGYLNALGTLPHELEEYLIVGALPRALALKRNDDIMRMSLEMERRIIERDLAGIVPMDEATKSKVYRLIHTLALSDRSSLESLSRDLELSKPTLIAVVAALERAGLLLRVRPFGSQATRNRKTSKYAFMAPSMRAAHFWDAARPLDDHRVLGPLLEDAVASGLHMRGWTGPRVQVDYDYHDGGADLLVGNGFDPPIAIGVGYGSKDEMQIKNTAERHKIRYGITISERQLSLSEDGNVIRLPKDMALMLL